MNPSGIVHSYDPRAASSAAMNRAIMAPHYIPVNTYGGDVSSGMVSSPQRLSQQHHNLFAFGAYTTGASNAIVPAFANTYVSQRQYPPIIQPEIDVGRIPAYQQSQGRGFVGEHSQSPVVKSEHQWNMSTHALSHSPALSKVVSPIPLSPGAEPKFKTEVDTLMKAIQTKASQPQSKPSSIQSKVVEDTNQNEKKKRYICTIDGCSKTFSQKTHLDIHERSHTGHKPYACKEPGCNRTFSQLGNLKTHERRHTGERPYKCDRCEKRFAQRGNVRAHRIVHDQTKPFECKLDDCGKKFTQLGNLKSHQNKFHINTIRDLTAKFASIQDGDLVHAADKELWEYFAALYKNSNKGIKGRGRDRKVGPSSMTTNIGLRGLGMSVSGGYSMSGAGRSNMVMGAMGAGRAGSHYEMFDADDTSQTSGQSTIGTCYDDAPSEPYEETTRGGDLAFGDRIY